MAAELSPRQAEILAFISHHCSDTGYPPTVREIGLAVGLASPSTVHAHLAKLADGGHITRDATKPRAMLVNEDRAAARRATRRRPARDSSRDAARLPIVGSVAAGMPRLAEDNVEDWVDTPFVADFLLRVVGESMRDAGILNGDLVAVKQQATAEDGQIVVALVEDDEATVKRFFRRDGHIVLQPENDAFEPIIVDDVTILGRVVGVLRTM
jgi:repressor LexA